MNVNEKHGLFLLTVREFGVESCTATPSSAATFLLMIAEAISSGFWVANGGGTS